MKKLSILVLAFFVYLTALAQNLDSQWGVSVATLMWMDQNDPSRFAGYVLGVKDSNPSGKICMPPKQAGRMIPLNSFLTLVRAYAVRYPMRRDELATDFVTDALAERWPCR